MEEDYFWYLLRSLEVETFQNANNEVSLEKTVGGIGDIKTLIRKKIVGSRCVATFYVQAGLYYFGEDVKEVYVILLMQFCSPYMLGVCVAYTGKSQKKMLSSIR